MMDTSDTSFGNKVREFINSIKRKKIVALIGILVLVAVVPLTVFLSQQQKDIRQKANTDQATISVVPNTIAAGGNVAVYWTIANNNPAPPTSTPTQTPTPTPVGSITISAVPTTVTQGGAVRMLWSYQGRTPNAGDYVQIFTSTNGHVGYIYLGSCTSAQGAAPATTGECSINTTSYAPDTYMAKAFRFDNRTTPISTTTFGVTAPATTPTVPTRPQILGGVDCARTGQVGTYLFNVLWPQSVTGITSVEMGTTNTFAQKYTAPASAFKTSGTNYYVKGPIDFTGAPNPFPLNTTFYFRLMRGTTAGEVSTYSVPSCSASIQKNTEFAGSFSFIPKAYAQAAITGAETLRMFSTEPTPQAIGKQIYLNCNEKNGTNPPATAPIYSGNCPFTVPLETPSGSYVFRMYAADGTTVLGTSAAFSVTASANAPTLSASPNPCVLNAQGLCTTTLTWDGKGLPNIKINVKENPNAIVSTAGSGTSSIPWIGAAGYTFQLYSGDTLFKTVTVKGISQNTIGASPNPCILNAAGRCSTTIFWSTENKTDVKVTVRENNNQVVLSGPTGAALVDWVTADGATLDLYSGSTLLSSVVVKGIAQNTVGAKPKFCVVNAQGTCTITLFWSTENKPDIKLMVRGNPSSLITAGPVTGTVLINWITTQGATFDLYSGSTIISSIYVKGVTQNTIGAAPNPCDLNGENMCASYIYWSSDKPNVTIKVKIPGQQTENLFAAGPAGMQEAPWITAAGVIFNLYSDSTLLNSLTVTSQATEVPLKPVYRFSLGNEPDFYTLNETEKNQLIQSNTWQYKGIAWYAYATSKQNVKPVYRLNTKADGAFWFFTASEAEKNQLIASNHWNDQGIGWYAYTTSQEKTKPVYRLYFKENGARHFFTINEAQKDELIQGGKWALEGIGWYAYPAPSQSSIQFEATALLNGIGTPSSSINPHHPNRNAWITLFNSSNTPIATKTGIITYDLTSGSFTGLIDKEGMESAPAVPAGNYTLKIQTPQFLRKNIPGIFAIQTNSTTTLPAIRLTNGDVNMDNKINILDFNMILSCYGNKASSSDCLITPQFALDQAPAEPLAPLADLNDDGAVNEVDLNIFITNLNTKVGD